jgi:DNA-binding response OmpR family regulator
MKILIADDEMMSRRLLQETLVRAGYEVDHGWPCWTGRCLR